MAAFLPWTAACLVWTVVTDRPRCLLHRTPWACGGIGASRVIVSLASMVGYLEERKSHPQDKGDGTRKGEWNMMENETTPVVPAGAKRVIRRLGGWLCTHAHAERVPTKHGGRPKTGPRASEELAD